MPSLERPKFIQIATSKSNYEWHLFALDENGDIWSYVEAEGWQKENMERLDDNSATA